MTQPQETVHRRSVKHLASFCRGEMSARDSFIVALTYPAMEPYREVLTYCRDSHQRRADLLVKEIEQLRGEAPRSSGPWGTLVDIIERAAIGMGQRAAIAALREGEDHGLRDYRADSPKLDPAQRKFVEDQILPGQLDTHRAITKLEQSVS